MRPTRSFALRSLLLASSMLLPVALGGCDNDPAAGKTKASVKEAEPVAPKVEAGAASVEYAFSSDGSKIGFVGAKVTGKHEGTLGRFRGTIRLVDGDATKSAVGVEIEMDSLQADVDKLTAHLKSADFFDVARFPTARFDSTAVEAGGEGGATHTVTGNLELHGVTKSIRFPATIQVQGDAIHVDAEFAIDRQDFGVAYPGMPDDLIKDEILVRLEIRAKKGS